MTCKHNEETDYIIDQQLISILKEFSHGGSIISDDTYDYDLLAPFQRASHVNVPVLIECPVQSRTVFDINATV